MQAGFTIQAVNNILILTYGTQPRITLYIAIGICNRQHFHSNLLGADFLQHYNLLVDMSHNRLIDAVTSLVVQGLMTHVTFPSPALLPWQPRTTFEAILHELPAVT